MKRWILRGTHVSEGRGSPWSGTPLIALDLGHLRLLRVLFPATSSLKVIAAFSVNGNQPLAARARNFPDRGKVQFLWRAVVCIRRKGGPPELDEYICQSNDRESPFLPFDFDLLLSSSSSTTWSRHPALLRPLRQLASRTPRILARRQGLLLLRVRLQTRLLLTSRQRHQDLVPH